MSAHNKIEILINKLKDLNEFMTDFEIDSSLITNLEYVDKVRELNDLIGNSTNNIRACGTLRNLKNGIIYKMSRSIIRERAVKKRTATFRTDSGNWDYDHDIMNKAYEEWRHDENTTISDILLKYKIRERDWSHFRRELKKQEKLQNQSLGDDL